MNKGVRLGLQISTLAGAIGIGSLALGPFHLNRIGHVKSNTLATLNDLLASRDIQLNPKHVCNFSTEHGHLICTDGKRGYFSLKTSGIGSKTKDTLMIDGVEVNKEGMLVIDSGCAIMSLDGGNGGLIIENDCIEHKPGEQSV